MKKFVHQLNLDTIGGVENLFANYIGLSELLSHELLVSGKRIHPQLQAAIDTHVDVVKYIKYLGLFKLPRPLRKLRCRWVFNSLKPDMIIFWNRASHAAEVAMAQKIPYIYYDHGLAWLRPDPDHYRAFLNRATKVIACGHSVKRMLELRWDVPEDKIIVVPNGFREDAIPENLHPKHIDQSRPLRLGVAGRLVPLKGTTIVIHTLKELLAMGVDAELQIAGHGKEIDSLKETVSTLGLENKVTFLGVIKNMHDFYQSIDFFVTATLRDPFPLVLIEALSHGCVPIATSVDGCPDIIEQGKTGYCIEPTLTLSDYPALGGSLKGMPACVYNPSKDALSEVLLPDPVHMAQMIKRLVDSPEEYHAMSQQGIEAGKTRFKFSDYVKGLDQAIRESL